MEKESIQNLHYQSFESLKELNEYGQEFWRARKLAKILAYSEYRNLLPVIKKAKHACKKSAFNIDDHFMDVNEMVGIGSGAKRKVADIMLSRYACYLVVQNADSSKPVIANGQTYFAIQTRRQELSDSNTFQQPKENEKRLFLRNELRSHNKKLVGTAQQAGVASHLDFAIFQNHGYKGLYGGA